MGRLFRRVVRTARRTRRASRGSTVRSADGRQYRVVAVNETEDTEFADPPRKWGRVGLMAGAWALALAFGGWAAPGIAASGNPENTDSRDELASSAKQATNRYLRYGSDLDLDRAKATLCDNASPEITPSDLDAIRQSYDDEMGGITRIDIETGDPVATADGTTVAATVSYVSDARSSYMDFVVTLQEKDGGYCVSNAVRISAEEPGSDEGSNEAADSQELATDFMRSIVNEQDVQAATALQCAQGSYEGISPEELDEAIADWAEANGETVRFLSAVELVESSETSATTFEVQISLKADLITAEPIFTVGVEGNCVSSLRGGDGLM